MFVGRPGGGVFADGKWQWRASQAGGAGAGGELIASKNTEVSRCVTATCSPRVGITLAGACQARLRRRKSEYPPQARPARAMAQVDGSGTATGLARRKPKLSASALGPELLMPDDEKKEMLKPKSPPP